MNHPVLDMDTVALQIAMAPMDNKAMNPPELLTLLQKMVLGRLQQIQQLEHAGGHLSSRLVRERQGLFDIALKLLKTLLSAPTQGKGSQSGPDPIEKLFHSDLIAELRRRNG